MKLKAQKFSSRVEPIDSKVWGHHFLVPDAVVEYYMSKDIKRLICTVNQSEPYHCALMSKGEGGYFIRLNKEMMKQLKLHVGSEVDAGLVKDESRYGMHLPEEMEVLMDQDPEGTHYFEKLTPGKKRSLLHLIGKPKSSEVRLRKALVVIQHLKLNGGILDFKQLNEEMKVKR